MEQLSWQIPLFLKIFFAIFLLAGLVGTLVSHSSSALGIYKAYFIEPFLFFIVVFDYLVTTKNFRLVLYSLIGSGIWIALIAIANQLLHYNPGNPAEFLQRARSSGVYSTSNAVGLLIGPLSVLLFGYILSLKNGKKPLKNEFKYNLIALLILLGGLVSSGSRGAYLGIFAALIFFLIYFLYLKMSSKVRNFSDKLFILLIIVFFSAIVLFFINISTITKITLNNKEKLPANLVSRVCLWEGSVRAIKLEPVTGVGLSNFQAVQVKEHTCSSEKSIYPHNIFLNFWSETGVFGLISFIAICGYCFFKLVGLKKTDYFNIALAAVFIEILFHGLLDVPYFKNDLSVLFWTIVALSLWRIKVFTDQEKQESPLRQ
ncbi:MAG TPA: O-antigen ligase family protein [Candidatus Saccharimonadales bacterium]|nr:O-antigen ligase family protein [Candidatus Saccharimonadales bacterium]